MGRKGAVGRGDGRRADYTPTAIAISVALVILISALVLLPGYKGEIPEDVDLTVLPLINAILNGMSFVLLALGLAAVRRRRVEAHRRYVLAASAATFLFFLSYVAYHFLASSTTYGGEGVLRYVYFFVLISHVLMAIATLPLALISLFSGMRMDVRRHRRIARWAMPLWLYTSASGVLVYLLVSPYY